METVIGDRLDVLIGVSARLAEILRHQAALLEHIVTDQRYYSDYFRVAFYGNFPVGIRNKQFVVSTWCSLLFT